MPRQRRPDRFQIQIAMSTRGPSGIAEAPESCLQGPHQVPATFLQQRLWFLNQLQPEDVSYLIPWSFRLSGSLDAAALERTLNEIVRRHEVLRTTFALAGEE